MAKPTEYKLKKTANKKALLDTKISQRLIKNYLQIEMYY